MRYFTYIAAFGAFTDVYETPQQFKNIIGHLHIFSRAKRMGNPKSYKMRIEYDGNIVKMSLFWYDYKFIINRWFYHKMMFYGRWYEVTKKAE